LKGDGTKKRREKRGKGEGNDRRRTLLFRLLFSIIHQEGGRTGKKGMGGDDGFLSQTFLHVEGGEEIEKRRRRKKKKGRGNRKEKYW